MIKSKYNVILFHGYHGTNDGHWFPWLLKKLVDLGVEVVAPQFPEETTLEKWLEVFETFKNKINENTILIGHSLGSAMILAILPLLEKPIAHTILISGFGKPFGETKEDEECNAFVQSIAWKKVKAYGGSISLFGSTNDEIPLDVFAHLGASTGSPIQFIENAGHFCSDDGFDTFPTLLEYIKTKLYLTYEEFKKLDARVGCIKHVEPIEGADKLLRFEIDFGEENLRQIVSGIKEFYPEYEMLVGKKALYVLNLEPREIKGVVSYGMLMAVDGAESNPVFLVPEQEVNPGSKVR